MTEEDEEYQQTRKLSHLAARFVRGPVTRALLSLGLSKRKVIRRRKRIAAIGGFTLGFICGPGAGLTATGLFISGFWMVAIPTLIVGGTLAAFFSSVADFSDMHRRAQIERAPERLQLRQERQVAREREMEAVFNDIALKKPLETVPGLKLRGKRRAAVMPRQAKAG